MAKGGGRACEAAGGWTWCVVGVGVVVMACVCVQVRHGAAVALREVLRGHAGSASVDAPLPTTHAQEPTGWALPGGTGGRGGQRGVGSPQAGPCQGAQVGGRRGQGAWGGMCGWSLVTPSCPCLYDYMSISHAMPKSVYRVQGWGGPTHAPSPLHRGVGVGVQGWGGPPHAPPPLHRGMGVGVCSCTLWV